MLIINKFFRVSEIAQQVYLIQFEGILKKSFLVSLKKYFEKV